MAVNTLNRQLAVEGPNRAWAFTYVWTTEGRLYLAVILDLFLRRVVDWAMGHRLTVNLAERALAMAFVSRSNEPAFRTIRIAAISMQSRAASTYMPPTAPWLA